MKARGIIESAQVRSERISVCFSSSIVAVVWQMYRPGEERKGIYGSNGTGKRSWVLNRFWQRRKVMTETREDLVSGGMNVRDLPRWA